MRIALSTQGALVALGVALQGCASTPAPAPIPTITDPASPTIGMGEAFGAPSDLDGAVLQAQMLRKLGDFEGATRTLSQLVLVAPDDPRVLGEYGKTLAARGYPDDALAFLNRALELQPNDWSLYSAKGVALDQKGDYVRAKAAYDQALNLKPGDPTVLSNAGLSRMQAGDLDAAESYLLAASDAGGNHPRIASNLALVQRLKRSRGLASVAAVPPPAPMPAVQPEPAPSIPAPSQIEETPLPPPGQTGPLTGIEALKADPTVVLAPIPEPEETPAAAISAAVQARSALAAEQGELRRLSSDD